MKSLWWLRNDPLALIGLIILIIFAFAAIFAAQVSPFDPTEQHLSDTLKPPSELYRFGTDQFGRDILSRVIHGTQISLGLGSGAVIIAVTVGTTIGLTAGYVGDRTDEIIMRVIDIFFAFPPIVLAIFLMATLGPSLLNVVLVVALVTIPQFTRIARSVAISERNQDYVLAARAMGASTASVIRRHLLVNAFPPLAIQVTVLLGRCDFDRSGAELLGHRRPAAHADLGRHLERRARLCLHRFVVVHRVPGPGDFSGGVLVERTGRRLARLHRPNHAPAREWGIAHKEPRRGDLSGRPKTVSPAKHGRSNGSPHSSHAEWRRALDGEKRKLINYEDTGTN